MTDPNPPFQPVPQQQWTPPVQQGPPIANAQGVDIAGFILVWFMPPVALILGHVGRNQAKRAGYKPCALSTWTLVLGWLFIAFWIVVIVLLFAAGIYGAAHSGGTGPGGY